MHFIRKRTVHLRSPREKHAHAHMHTHTSIHSTYTHVCRHMYTSTHMHAHTSMHVPHTHIHTLCHSRVATVSIVGHILPGLGENAQL